MEGRMLDDNRLRRLVRMSIPETTPDTPMILADGQSIAYVNQAFEMLTGLASTSVMGENVFEVIPETRHTFKRLHHELDHPDSEGDTAEQPGFIKGPLEADRWSRTSEVLWRQVSIGNRVFQCECFRVETPDCECFQGIVPPPDTERIGFVMRDITAEHAIHNQWMQAEKVASLERLTAGIAHETNSPLYAMQGLAEIIRDNNDPDGNATHAASILAHIRHISSVIQNVAGFARSRDDDTVGDVDVNQTLDASVTLASKGFVTDQIRIARHYQAVHTVWAASEDIQQIFVNIMENAFQAMNGKGSLFLSSEEAPGFVTVTIRDTGPGVPPAYVTKIFDPFFTTKLQGEGDGLGLTIASHIARKYGGDIRFETQEERGAAFRICLPIQDAESR